MTDGRLMIPRGREIKTTRIGQMIFEGQVNTRGNYDGLVRRTWLKDDGSYEIYEGQMRNGAPFGFGRRIQSDDSVYEGEWMHGSTIDIIKLGQELIVGEQLY